jgi:hypothetical protein
LSQSEATILNLSVDGLNVEEAASATGLPLDFAQEAIETLITPSARRSEEEALRHQESSEGTTSRIQRRVKR